MARSKRSARSRRAEREIVEQPRGRAARRDDHLVQVRVVGDDRRGRRLDDIGEMRVGETRAAARGWPAW